MNAPEIQPKWTNSISHSQIDEFQLQWRAYFCGKYEEISEHLLTAFPGLSRIWEGLEIGLSKPASFNQLC